MGMPGINISFSEVAATAIRRGERGVIGMILKGTVPSKNPVEVYSVKDIPSTFSNANKEQLQLALAGYVNAPRKIVAYCIGASAEDYTEALDWFEVNKFDYLVIPTVETDGKTKEIASWIKSLRGEGKRVKAVLPNSPSDSEGIINYTTEAVTADGVTYTAEQYCSRIAGIIAGTPLTIACTYAPLSELSDCTRLKKDDMDKAVDAGEFIVFFDGVKVKVARGVNSLVTTTDTKGAQFKKIKIVEAMDMIHDDIKTTAEDSYLGKYANSYDNKCLLISAINGYFSKLIADGILSSAEVGIDVNANRIYLESKGEDVKSLNDDEIKTHDTGDQVFLYAKVKILDAIEEITLPISI